MFASSSSAFCYCCCCCVFENFFSQSWVFPVWSRWSFETQKVSTKNCVRKFLWIEIGKRRIRVLTMDLPKISTKNCVRKLLWIEIGRRRIRMLSGRRTTFIAFFKQTETKACTDLPDSSNCINSNNKIF